MCYNCNVMSKLCLISDTHCQLNKILHLMPEADILIHCGDATYRGTIEEISRFNHHLGEIKHKYKHILFVAGNHDWLFETNLTLARSLMTNATVLIDETITIDGFNIYGSPWQPFFCHWAFNFPENDNGAAAKTTWAKIPNNTNILITHGPPRGILDNLHEGKNPEERVGCPYLLERIKELKELKLACFGHLHRNAEDHKIEKHGNITFVNASICDESYKPVNPPITFLL